MLQNPIKLHFRSWLRAAAVLAPNAALDTCSFPTPAPFPHDPARVHDDHAKTNSKPNSTNPLRKSSKINRGTRQKGTFAERLVNLMKSMPELVKNTASGGNRISAAKSVSELAENVVSKYAVVSVFFSVLVSVMIRRYSATQGWFLRVDRRGRLSHTDRR